MASESKLQSKIQEHLRSKGYFVVNVVRASRGGVPDILCCLNGAFVAIEVKVGKNKESPLQIYNAHQIRKAGGVAVVIRSMVELRAFLGEG